MKSAVAPLSVKNTALVVLFTRPVRRIVATEGLLTEADRTSRGVIDDGGRCKLMLGFDTIGTDGTEGE
jgi:hypothetical protein